MKHIIIVSGKLESGKDAFATKLMESLRGAGVSVRHGKFASSLKKLAEDSFTPMCNEINSLIEGVILDLRLSSGDIVAEHVYECLKPLITKPENFWEEKTLITRHLLQQIGTEIVQPIDKLHWTKQLKSEFLNMEESVMVVTDCRFPHEINFFRNDAEDYKVTTLRIERPFHKRDMSNPIHSHVSETALDAFHFHDTVVNDKDLAHLHRIAEAYANRVVLEN